MKKDFKSKNGKVTIDVFSAWWYAKRKNIQAVPDEAAQEIKDKHWPGGDWRLIVQKAVNGVFGNVNGFRDARHMNTHDRVSWACDEIRQIKGLFVSAVSKQRRDSDGGIEVSAPWMAQGANHLDGHPKRTVSEDDSVAKLMETQQFMMNKMEALTKSVESLSEHVMH